MPLYASGRSRGAHPPPDRTGGGLPVARRASPADRLRAGRASHRGRTVRSGAGARAGRRRHVTPEEKEQLGHDIAAAAVLRGEFTLRSGQTDSYYIDKYRLTTEPGLLVAHHRRPCRLVPDGVIGSPGPRLAPCRCHRAFAEDGLAVLFVRVDAAQGHGTSKSIEGLLNTGDRVLLVEDVVTTGGASLTAVELLRAAGARVRGGHCRRRPRTGRCRRAGRGCRVILGAGHVLNVGAELSVSFRGARGSRLAV